MSIKTNVADYLTQIEKLTNTNLQILKAINDSFFTKKNHIFAEIDDVKYVIPSFLSLENKINMLQENFENLIKSPETSEAYFNFNGNTRAIEVRKYNHVPDEVTLPKVSTYDIEHNNIFKDFMTPTPYINFELPTMPNDIVEVNVKKIVAKSDLFKSAFRNKLSYTKEEIGEDDNVVIKTYYHDSINESAANMYKFLMNYNKDDDYIEYDTICKLPIRKNIGSSTYVIESVVSDKINEMLEETITLKLRNDLKDSKYNNNLTYRLFDNTIEKPLQVGDELINFDGTGKVEITEIRPLTNTIVVKVVNGEYLNFLGTDSYDTSNDTDIHDMSKLRFYEATDFDAHKYVKLPLEDDQYIFVCVAPINSRMNIQASWGTGTLIDTYSLTKENISFNSYYQNNVKNIGDVLFEMTSIMSAPVTSLSKYDFDALTSLKPIIDTKLLSVMQINKHLNNSENVNNIRSAYRQKKEAESKLASLQEQIDDVSKKLSKQFNDDGGVRKIYVSQLSQYNEQKNNLLSIINNAINEISLNVNASEIPIDNAKYRIRGFYIPSFGFVNGLDVNSHVIGLQVQYRYKNVSSELGTAVSISNDNKTYIYSDWNTLNTPLKKKIATYNETFKVYNYEYENNNEEKNEPSFNQIDIPISQGETVDIRIKVIYDFGQPYATIMSDWSDIVNIEFPVEFTKDVPILTIIEENNNDIETNRFVGILETAGVKSHIDDSIMDQNITFYHKPEHISSGFYTNERRIIPLKDKLSSMSNEIAQLNSYISGADESIQIYVKSGEVNTKIYPDRYNTILLKGFKSISEDTEDGVYTKNNGVVSTMLNICIANKGTAAMRLYSIFPGNRDILINDKQSGYAKISDYSVNTGNTKGGVWLKYKTSSANNKKLQTYNQFITFRVNDVWTGDSYYLPAASPTIENKQCSTDIISVAKDTNAMSIYPYINSEYSLCINSDSIKSYIIINPGEEISIPIYCEYSCKKDGKIEKTMSFDIRTSLYNDPTNYAFKVIGKYDLTVSDKIINKNDIQMSQTIAAPGYNNTL